MGNDRALGTGKSNNNNKPKKENKNNNKNNVRGHWAPGNGCKNLPYFGFGNLATLPAAAAERTVYTTLCAATWRAMKAADC